MKGIDKEYSLINLSCVDVLQRLPIATALLYKLEIVFANQPFITAIGIKTDANPVGMSLSELISRQAIQAILDMISNPPPGENPNCIIKPVKNAKSFYNCFAQTIKSKNRELTLLTLTESKNKDERAVRTIYPRIAMAERMQAVERLAGEVAHDFNNMLNGVMGYAELLKKHVNTHEGQHFLDSIIESAMDASGIATKLLEFASASKKTSHLFDLNHAIKKAIKMANGRSTSLGMQLEPNYSEAKLTILGDMQAITRAVLNIITNAIEASGPADIIEVSTELHNHTKPNGLPKGNYAVITISDHGYGVPERFREQIFEPFFSTKTRAKRSGLGLSIVYNTLKDHDGIIEMDSEEGKGTTFRLYLPLHSDDESGLEEKDGCILVVDDDKGVRKLLEKLLKAKGLQSISAANGYDAVEVVQTRGDLIKLVLLDMVMPGMDGRTCYEKMIQIKPDLGVVVMSGYCEGNDVNFADAFISKPFKIATLYTTVNKFLSKKH